MFKTVTPNLAFNGLANPFTNRKKFEIECGSCGHIFMEKISLDKDEALALCPVCKTINRWSNIKAIQSYNRQSKK